MVSSDEMTLQAKWAGSRCWWMGYLCWNEVGERFGTKSRLEETGEGGRKTSGTDWESEAGNPGGIETRVSGLDSTSSLAVGELLSIVWSTVFAD